MLVQSRKNFTKPWWAQSDGQLVYRNQSSEKLDSIASSKQSFSVLIAGINVQNKLQQLNSIFDLNFQKVNTNSIKATIWMNRNQAWQLYLELLESVEELDVFLLPKIWRMQLLICDMDSTIIKGESLDELAATMGIGKKVAAITELAMRGEIDFYQAFRKRVELLKGLDLGICEQLARRTIINPGAKELVQAAKSANIPSLLVSGGIEPIVRVVANKLGFDRYYCNKLEENNGRLSGEIIAPVLDSESKLSILNDECRNLAIKPQQACAIGDGANDLAMLSAAGLGIAYHAKPIIRQSICNQINYSSLSTVIELSID